MLIYVGPRAPRVGSHGRRLKPDERRLVHWVLTRPIEPVSAAVLARVFAVHISTIYRAKASVAAALAREAARRPLSRRGWLQ